MLSRGSLGSSLKLVPIDNFHFNCVAGVCKNIKDKAPIGFYKEADEMFDGTPNSEANSQLGCTAPDSSPMTIQTQWWWWCPPPPLKQNLAPVTHPSDSRSPFTGGYSRGKGRFSSSSHSRGAGGENSSAPHTLPIPAIPPPSKSLTMCGLRKQRVHSVVIQNTTLGTVTVISDTSA